MFERYTEKARRTIFFARYEASQFGSPYIESEHLLRGLLREDKRLANQFLRSQRAVESILSQIEDQTTVREKVSTSVDLPLSHECKRVLTYGAEEAKRLNHNHIDTPHLLLGLLREEKSFAAQILRNQGLALDSVREQVQHLESLPAQGGFACIAALDRWLVEREAHADISAVTQKGVTNNTTHVAIYARDQLKENDDGQDITPAERLAKIKERIDFISEVMERAIANHEFEKARFYSDEERKERENLRLLCEKFNLEEPPARVPLLRIEIIHDDRFSGVQKRCDDYIAEGVAMVWLLDPGSRRAYTVTKAEGLREFKDEILRIPNPPLEMDLKKLFD
jgi:hypothetical protein